MARSLLPPRGVHVPVRMIYHPQLPPAVIFTWIQLRGLAWGGMVTPPLRMQELAALTGKCQATIYDHMSLLRRVSALSWRTTGSGTIIVTFAGKLSGKLDINKMPPAIPDSTILESQNSPSLNNHSSSLKIPGINEDIKESVKIIRNEVKGGDERESEGENLRSSPVVSSRFHDAFTGDSPTCQSSNVPTPITVYRSLAHLTPNAAQRQILSSNVTDLPLWQQTLEHWLGHGWNPKNLLVMLELYARGGPSGCRFCCRDRSPNGDVKTPLDHTLAAIDALRRKQGQPPGSE